FRVAACVSRRGCEGHLDRKRAARLAARKASARGGSAGGAGAGLWAERTAGGGRRLDAGAGLRGGGAHAARGATPLRSPLRTGGTIHLSWSHAGERRRVLETSAGGVCGLRRAGTEVRKPVALWAVLQRQGFCAARGKGLAFGTRGQSALRGS